MDRSVDKEKEIIAKANFCAGFLMIHGFLTDKQRDLIHKKILQYKAKHQVEILRSELDSVGFKIKKKRRNGKH